MIKRNPKIIIISAVLSPAGFSLPFFEQHNQASETGKYRRKKPREGKHRSAEHPQCHSAIATPILSLSTVPGTGTLTAKSEKSLGALLRQQPEGAERAEELDELEEFANFFKKQRIKHGMDNFFTKNRKIVFIKALHKVMWELHLANVMGLIFRRQVQLFLLF